MKTEKSVIIAELEDVGLRADVFLANELNCTRSHVKMLVDNGFVAINGKTIAKTGEIVKQNAVFTVEEPIPEEFSTEPENIPLDVVFEDEYLAVINKQAGLVCHPARGNESHTLVNALTYHFGALSTINGELRPGIVHRLDKDTTGLLVVAKCDKAHVSLSSQIADKTCHRVYYALLDGDLKSESGTVDEAIARSRADRKKMAIDKTGKRAVTDYKVIERFPAYTLTEFSLRTGRTHQIRVHAKFLGHPVTGDPLYGGTDKFGVGRQLLHAKKIGFNHPISGEYMEFETDLPKDFADVLAVLRSKKNN